MNIHTATPNSGDHTFDSKKNINIFDPSTYSIDVMPNNYNDSFQCNFQDHIKDQDKLRIFIFSEYLKRKFFLDITKDKKDEEFIKNKDKRYVSVELMDGCFFKFIAERLNINKNQKCVFEMNLKQYNLDYFNRQPNIYKSIKRLYKFGFIYFKHLIRLLINGRLNSPSSDIKIVSDFFKYNKLDNYLFERILYHLSSPHFNFGNHHQQSEKLIEIFNRNVNFYIFSTFAPLYKAIVDKYKLYLYDLLKNTDIPKMISNSKIDLVIPRFFFIPIEPKRDKIVESIVNYNFNSLKKRVSITIDLSNNFDSCDIANFVKDNIIVGMYKMKEDLSLSYSPKEISYMSALIDSDNEHNKFSNYEDRLTSLYLWDKFFDEEGEFHSSNDGKSPKARLMRLKVDQIIPKSKPHIEGSLSSTIIHFFRPSNNKKEVKSLTDMWTRNINGTSRCIENGQFLPLTGGQPKPAAG